MKRTLLEKIAGSFRVLMMCGLWGLVAVGASVLLDEFDKFRGHDYYGLMGIEDHATHVVIFRRRLHHSARFEACCAYGS